MQYTYVQNNPLRFTDPFGLIKIVYENTVKQKTTHTHKALLINLQKWLEELGYLDMHGASYGIDYAGYTQAAVQLFQLNYGLSPTSYVNDYTFLAIDNVIELKKYSNEMTAKAYYSAWVSTLKYFNNTNGFSLPYYRSFQCEMKQEIDSAVTAAMTGDISTANVNGIWYLDYTAEIDRALSVNIEDFFTHRIKYSYSEYFDKYITAFYVPSYETYFYGLVMPSLRWFYNQVKSLARWDLKEPKSWADVFGNGGITYYSINFRFIYRDEIIDSEDLGNLTFGFLGSAIGLTLESLKLGVWIAGDGEKEGERDSQMINRGVLQFFTDYSESQYPTKY